MRKLDFSCEYASRSDLPIRARKSPLWTLRSHDARTDTRRSGVCLSSRKQNKRKETLTFFPNCDLEQDLKARWSKKCTHAKVKAAVWFAQRCGVWYPQEGGVGLQGERWGHPYCPPLSSLNKLWPNLTTALKVSGLITNLVCFYRISSDCSCVIHTELHYVIFLEKIKMSGVFLIKL